VALGTNALTIFRMFRGDAVMPACRPRRRCASGRDDRALRPLPTECVQPPPSLHLSDRAGLHGCLGTPVGHAGVKTLEISLDWKEPAHPDVLEASALEE
jgi:hypothetical protein